MPSHKQKKAEIRLKLRNPPTDMGLADAESSRGPRHPTMTNHGLEQVDMGRIHHASSAWKRKDEAFDSMAGDAVKSRR
jgi:hypothetical protein